MLSDRCLLWVPDGPRILSDWCPLVIGSVPAFYRIHAHNTHTTRTTRAYDTHNTHNTHNTRDADNMVTWGVTNATVGQVNINVSDQRTSVSEKMAGVQLASTPASS